MIKFLDLKFQYNAIKPEIDQAISDVINSTVFIGGAKVAEFEKAFANFCNAKFCVGVANGTDALEIALWALDLQQGDEVIVPANGFIATSEAVTRNGLKVVFADVGADYLINAETISKALTLKTKAIIPVHLYGRPCDMQEIMEFANERGLSVIEDCSQAHGATYKGKDVGTFGICGTFSFYPGKNLGAYGDAGAIICDDELLAQKMRRYANHGRSAKYEHLFEGRNSRLDALQSAILSVKLCHLPDWIQKRREIAKYYIDNLSNLPLIAPSFHDEAVWHLFVIATNKRDDLKEFLLNSGVECGIHYPSALPKLKAYNYASCGRFFACDISEQVLSLPIGEHLTLKEAEAVVGLIKKFYAD